MKKNKEKNENVNKEKAKTRRNYDKGQIFVKVMAGVLALLMVAATGISVIYAIMG